MHCSPHLLLLSPRQEELRRGRREECFCNWSGRQWRLNGVIPPAYEILQRPEGLLRRPRESSAVQGAPMFPQPPLQPQEEPRIPCSLLEPFEFGRAPLRGLQPLRCVKCTQTEARESTEYEVRGSYLPTHSLAQLRLHMLPTASKVTHPLLLGYAYFGNVLWVSTIHV